MCYHVISEGPDALLLQVLEARNKVLTGTKVAAINTSYHPNFSKMPHSKTTFERMHFVK